MRWGNDIGDGPQQVRRPASFQDFPLRGVQVRRLGHGVTMHGPSILEHRARAAMHGRGTMISGTASRRAGSDWSAQSRTAYVIEDEVVRSFAHKSSMQLIREYKSRAKERILYQRRVADLHSELKITILVARRLLTESLELLNRVDASLVGKKSSISTSPPNTRKKLRRANLNYRDVM
jgi:hypothetical protein